jgi:hypothetical protein
MPNSRTTCDAKAAHLSTDRLIEELERCTELTHQSNGNHRDGLADAALAVPFRCTFVGVEYRGADRPPTDHIHADEFNIGRGDSA